MKMWSGRFRRPLNSEFEQWQRSFPFDRRLLPQEIAASSAHARALAQMVAMDAHPFIVPRVRKYLEEELRLDEAARAAWVRHWLDTGSRADTRHA